MVWVLFLWCTNYLQVLWNGIEDCAGWSGCNFRGAQITCSSRVLRTPSVLQESIPPRLTGPSALQGLFLLLTRGADNSRPDYTALSGPTEQLSYRPSVASVE